MIHNILRGQIVKGSCVDVMIKDFLGLGVKYQEINALTLSFYTTNPLETVVKTLEEVVIEGNSVIVHFEVGELDAMEDGVLRYIATYSAGEEECIKEKESAFYIKTPINHKELNFITDTELEEALEPYALKEEIPSLDGYATEQWVKDQNYLTEHQDLSDYAKKTDIPSLDGYATEEWVKDQNYLTEHQSLEGYATEQWVEDKHYLTEHQDLSEYATEKWVEDKNYLTEHQDLSEYAKKTDIPEIPENVSAFKNDAGYLTEHQSLEGYATEQWVEDKNYLTEHQDLSDYAKKTDIPTDDDIIALIDAETGDFIDTTELEEALEPYAKSEDIPSLDGYATEQWVKDQNYLTEHQSLDGYATEQWVEDKNYLTEHQDLSDYALKAELPVVPTMVSAFENDKGYLTEHQSLEKYALKTELPSLDGYATENWVNSKGYLTEHQDLTDYAKESWVLAQGFLTQHQDLSPYAKKTDLPKQVSQLTNDAGYLTEHQSLEDYYDKDAINQMFDNIENIQMVIVSTLPETGRTNVIYLVPKSQQTETDGYSEWLYLGLSQKWEKIGETTANLQGYATEKWVKNQGYLTEHQDLKTINGQSIVGSGNIVIQGGGEEATYSAGKNIRITSDHVISVTGITSYTGVTKSEIINSLGYTPAKTTDIPSLTGYATENWVNSKGYLTEHQPLKTINGQSIVGSGNIVIQGGSGQTYTAGKNINISASNVISVSGITSYTGITNTDVTNALGYTPAKSTDIPSLTGYATENWVLGKNYLTSVKTINGQSIVGTGNLEIKTSGDYLPLSGGTLTGHLTLGDSTTTAFKKVESIRDCGVNGVNGAAFYVNSDGTSAFFHKKYNGASATNDAILKFSASGLSFAANPSGTASDFKKVILESDLEPYATKQYVDDLIGMINNVLERL